MKLADVGDILQSRRCTSIDLAVARLKAFALLCCLVGLFSQSFAYAGGMPQAAMGASGHCAEMAAQSANHSGMAHPSDAANCCDFMTFDCIVTMGCIAPLAMTGPNQPASTSALINPAIYTTLITASLYGRPIPPELTPPQTNFTV